ncbi:MAG: type II secretion system secretin GspD [Granulosicoccaceae bacterium]
MQTARSAESTEATGLEVPTEGASPASSLDEAIYAGTGSFINRAAATLQPQVQVTGGDITLNFEKTDVQEVIKVVIGDLLKENYVIDPEVTGTVSLQTSNPVGREALLPMLETLLRMNDAVLVEEAGHYRISPLAGATQGTFVPSLNKRQLAPGFRIQVVPLQYIAAVEMQKILEPLVGEKAILRVDEPRNLLMLAGTSQELRSWLTTVDIFDVDWMKGYSVGLFPLEYTDAKTATEELKKIIGDKAEGMLGGMIRVEPLERLNAVLVITPQVRYLKEMRAWIERLDRPGSEPGIRLYVYQVKNRKASDLAAVVGDIFAGQRARREEPAPAALAPGLAPVTLTSPTLEGQQETAAGAAPDSPQVPGQETGAAGLTLLEGTDVRIVADEQNNSVLVLATAAEYKIVEAALRKLDVVPLQVLVEASIIEITLTDELRYGLEWFFKNNTPSSSKTSQGLLNFNSEGDIGPIIPGFSYAVVDAADTVRAVLNALASDSKLNVISSPSLMVLDNKTAEIRVGDQIPVRIGTQTAVGGTSIESIQYKDTGVLLKVTPRVNAGGLVTMEISQEVTDVGPIEEQLEGNRRFLQRNIQSTVAIQGGETIVLGGLITENNSTSESGVPGLYRIPVIGKLFGSTSETNQRRELVVLITPQVVENQQDAVEITEEFRKRLKKLQPPRPAPAIEVSEAQESAG